MRHGFSLIEIVVSIAILGVVLGALGALVHTAPLARINRNEDIALSIARNKLESLRTGGYDALPASGPWSDALLSALPSGTDAITVASYNSKVKRVDVTVSWQDAGQATRSVTLTTLIAQIGALP